MYQLILTKRFHAHCVAQNLSSLVEQYNITSLIFISPHPNHFLYMDSKHFLGPIYREINFDDTVLFLVTTSVQWSEVVHGPLCLLRCSLKTTAIEILCRMTVEKEKGMTKHTNCFFFLNKQEKSLENKRWKILDVKIIFNIQFSIH